MKGYHHCAQASASNPWTRQKRWLENRVISLIQFLDSDTILDPGWFSSAIKAIRPEKIGAVQGLLSELYPERSFYNWIGNLEWNGLKGECESFGGNVIVKREALEMTGGYDEEMVGGEDPELSRRIIRAGWKVIQAGVPMAQHDLAMTRFKQYLRRSFRTGYAFAAVRKLERSAGSRFWQYEYRKIIIKGGGFSFSLLLAIPLMQSGSSSQHHSTRVSRAGHRPAPQPPDFQGGPVHA